MLRIFLKSDHIYGLKPEKKSTKITQYFHEVENVVTMFKKLLKLMYPEPLSNFDLQEKLKANKTYVGKRKKDETNMFGNVMGKMGNVGGDVMGKMGSVGGDVMGKMGNMRLTISL